MGKRKSKVLLFVLLILTCQLLSAAVSEDNIKTYNLLYELQKDPKNLEQALDCTLSTVMYAEKNFPSQETAESLLKRIYSKIEIFEQFGNDDPVLVAIIKESTSDLLSALKTIDEETDKYKNAYHLLDFVLKDFSELIQTFHFERFKEYFSLNKLKNFQLIESIKGKQMQSLTSHIIDTIIQNDYYLNNTTYSGIVKLGKEKFLNYLSIQMNPHLDKKLVETLEQQYSLLKAYITLYQSFYGNQYEENIPKEKYDYFLELEEYYNYLSNVEILSRRFLTAEEQTLNTLFPVFFEYIKKYQTITMKTDKLNSAVLKLVKNASTRFSYDKNELLSKKYDLSELSVSNEEINESLKNLSTLLKRNTKKEAEKTQDPLSIFLSKPFLLIFIFVVIGLLLLFILVLPLKLKGTLFKNLGLSSKALTIFEKAAIKYPMDPDIHIKTAQIYEKLGREEEAMNEYKIASKVLDMKED
ncbi:MAG: hypothetical protein U9N62_10560 [Thermotogota bacterium]|nr:hypothetical protein [Thermotogota bacterium]